MVEKIVFCGKDISVHSFVDVITNSSSVVFIWPSGNSIKMMEDMIQNFMDIMKIPGKPSDYFEIDFRIDTNDWSGIKERFEEKYSCYKPKFGDLNSVERFRDEFGSLWYKLMPEGPEPTEDYEKDWETVKNHIMSLRGVKVWNVVPSYSDYHDFPESIIVSVSPIGDPGTNIAKNLLKMVEADAYYNG
jgi:hypothetical protein